MPVVSYSDSDIVRVNNQENVLEVNITSANYADEVYTTSYINSVFQGLNNALSGIQKIFLSASKYFEDMEDISNNTQQPDILEFNFNEIGMLEEASLPIIGIGSGVVSTQEGNLNLRAEPSTSSNVLTRMSKGSNLTILEYVDDQWVKVQDENGNIGYASRKFINENNDTVTIDMSESGSLHQPTGVTGTSETTIREGTVNLSSGHLNVRSSPNGEIIDLLDNNTRLEIVEYNPNGWSKIKLEDGTEAYVYSKYLKV